MNNLHILLVEDDLDIQLIAQMALETVGHFTVHIYSSGEQFLADQEQKQPDIILLDVMMPGMDGPSTLKSLRELTVYKHTPVAFMTAKVQPSEISYFLSLGACGVISKPFNPMTLATQVYAIWEQAISSV